MMIQREVNPIIFQVGETLRISSILLQPFLPWKANEALHRLGVMPEHREVGDARFGANFEYGRDRRPWEVGDSWKALFNKHRVDLELPPEERKGRSRRKEVKKVERREEDGRGKQSPFMEMVGKIAEALEKR